jgi:tRNA(His) 5'-end guanylyltransferase
MPRPRGSRASWEIYSDLKVRHPLVIRADGRGFGKILEGRRKPYDPDFARSLAGAASRFFQESGMDPALAFLFSDEINLLFLDAPFGGRVEKLDSVVASFLSGALSLAVGRVVSMDARVIPLCASEIEGYLAERQDETWRNHVFSYGFYALVEDGSSRAEAMERLRGMREPQIHELLFQRGINLARTPAWQRRGILVHRAEEEVVQSWDLPLFRSEEGRRILEEIIRLHRERR